MGKEKRLHSDLASCGVHREVSVGGGLLEVVPLNSPACKVAQNLVSSASVGYYCLTRTARKPHRAASLDQLARLMLRVRLRRTVLQSLSIAALHSP